MRWIKGLIGLAGLFGVSCSTAQSAKRKTMLNVGETAPDLQGKNAQGHSIKLSELKGQQVIVYFYPKDETPGCTKEACAFRDVYHKFTAANIKILGVSRDSEATHRKFQEHHKLPFYLVADEKGLIQDAYGVGNNLVGMTSRVSFLIGPDGRVQFVWPNVNPSLHAEEVLSKAQTFNH